MEPPKQRILKVEDYVLTYLADLSDQVKASLKAKAYHTIKKKTGQPSPVVQSNTASVRPGS